MTTCWPQACRPQTGRNQKVEFQKHHPVQFCSVAQSCLTLSTPWIAARQASLSIINSWSLLKPMSIESVMPSNHRIPCYPLLLLPPIRPRVFSNESTLHMMWPKYWSFSFSISSSNEHPGLISFRMDWLDLLAVQGTLLPHHKPIRRRSMSWSRILMTFSPNTVFKNTCLNAIRESGVFECEPPILLAWSLKEIKFLWRQICSRLSAFRLVWPHCASGTWTWTAQ